MGVLGRKIISQGKGPHHGSVGRIIPKHRKAGIQDAVTYMKYIIHNPGNCSKKQHKKQNSFHGGSLACSFFLQSFKASLLL